MTEIPVEVVGSVAGALTTLAFVPQVVTTLRTRSTRDISLTMWVAFTLGVAMWIAYGILTEAWPVIIANSITLALSSIVLAIKLANRD